MISPRIIEGLQPLLVDDKSLYAASGNDVYRLSAGFKKENNVGSFKEGILKDLFAYSALYKRVLRKGLHGLSISGKGDMVALANKMILFKAGKDSQFKSTFQGFKGNRPLCVKYFNNRFYFGEYFSNPERASVRIFASEQGTDWKPVYEFPAGTIRHIHGIQHDPFRNGMWILTGDEDSECAVWFADYEFRSVTPVVKGGQKARAVNIIVQEDSLIIPMDSPSQQNYIQRYTISSGELCNVAEIPGSAFHALETDGILLVTTVTEPSQVNITSHATMWASIDGINWKCLFRAHRDLFPVNMQFIFRYAELALTPGINNTPYVTAYGRALKGMDDCLMIWEKDAIRNFLK